MSKQAKIKALEHAYKRIQTSGDTFVCVALSDYECRNGDTSTAHSLKKYISKAIEGCGTLDDWLKEKYGVVSNIVLDAEKLKQTRLAWIKWMVVCLEEDIANGLS